MPQLPADPRRRCIPFHHWPTRDRALWQAGTAPGDGVDRPLRDAGLSPRSLEKFAEGYGRWLGFLDHQDWLGPDQHPAERVTPERVQAFVQLMRELDNSDYTLVGRLHELRMALRIIAPDRDFSWLTNPGGTAVRSLLPMRKRSLVVPDTRVLFRWGLELMDEALGLHGNVRRRVQYRDGLLIALLARRGLRLRTVAAMRLGRHVRREGDRFRLVFAPEDVKTRTPLETTLPRSLTRHVERYLAVERLELLAGQRHDAFWVNWDGSPLGARGLEKRIRWWSEKRFGVAFGPHRFRHALATTAPLAIPQSPGLAAAVLGITAQVLQEHYDRGGRAHAAAGLHDSLREGREQTAGLAERAFAETHR